MSGACYLFRAADGIQSASVLQPVKGRSSAVPSDGAEAK